MATTNMLSRHLILSDQINWRFLGITKAQAYTTQAAPKPSDAADGSVENARPYSEVPGPSKLELIWLFLPGGEFSKKPFFTAMAGMEKKYGPLFRFPGIFDKPEIVIDLNPADYPIIFRNEGPWPNRRVFDTFVYHREKHRGEFFQGVEGIISTSGEKWAKMRTAVNPILMQPKNAKLYLNTLLEINNEFLERIRHVRDPETLEVPGEFLDDINRLAFEGIAGIALNTRLGLIHKNRDSAEGKTIMKGIRSFFVLSEELEIKPSIWKYVKTPKFYEMMRTLDTLTDICNKYISEALVRIERDSEGKLMSEVGKEKSVLEKLVRVNKKFAVVMALDMILAGIDTTSSTLTGLLICIAKNPDKQQKLFEEISQILPHKDSQLTIENMQNLPYLRACIKESIRQYPIIPGTVRRLSSDVVLSGYRIPAGTDISIGANLLMRDERYVPQPDKFIPERWLRNDNSTQALEGQISNPFMYVPFGFGPRSCVGKRIVNLELEITLARLVRNFYIEFNYPTENAFEMKFMSVPQIPLKFKFAERRE
ncbi:probable cytochrome P450 12e1, mitochondrial [Rhagoletis pomonella]|uniref:probable cytochrome P450 12e1, mitochondrial n=1 Tax=Rhagoletis pomonella TaxID=28610 RepID=UPI001780F3F7|nr:probable cytochrome P450 12e1, mitochondrial [Rhagoletis pomonella]